MVSSETLSMTCNSTRRSAIIRAVQVARPSGTGLHAVAMTMASALPSRTGLAPGRAFSLRAASRPPSAKRRRTLATVPRETPTASTISSSVSPASARSRISARFRWRLEHAPASVRVAAGSAQVTRAQLARLIYWLVPGVRAARGGAARIASDVVGHDAHEEIVRIVNLGLLRVDETLHVFEPDRLARRGEALEALLSTAASAGAACARQVEGRAVQLDDLGAEVLQQGDGLVEALDDTGLVALAAELLDDADAHALDAAVAGGLELLLCCDLILAAQGARIGDGHARYGVVPAGGATVRLRERISPSRAAQLFYTADLVDAETLHAWGLVNEVLPADQLMNRARELARAIARCSPEAVACIKALSVPAHERERRFEAELEHFARHVDGSDLARGLAAFRSKQPPPY